MLNKHAFLFLKDDFPNVEKSCAQMEKAIVYNLYESAIVMARKIGEEIAIEILNKNYLTDEESESQQNRIDKLKRCNLIDEVEESCFQDIRLHGNHAAHSVLWEDEKLIAYQVHKEIYYLTSWFYKTYINELYEIPDYPGILFEKDSKLNIALFDKELNLDFMHNGSFDSSDLEGLDFMHNGSFDSSDLEGLDFMHNGSFDSSDFFKIAIDEDILKTDSSNLIKNKFNLSKSKYCYNCGNFIDVSEDNFCNNCGVANIISEDLNNFDNYCNSCGASVDIGFSYCVECGHEVNEKVIESFKKNELLNENPYKSQGRSEILKKKIVEPKFGNNFGDAYLINGFDRNKSSRYVLQGFLDFFHSGLFKIILIVFIIIFLIWLCRNGIVFIFNLLN